VVSLMALVEGVVIVYSGENGPRRTIRHHMPSQWEISPLPSKRRREGEGVSLRSVSGSTEAP
jgi:hypothetical protein